MKNYKVKNLKQKVIDFASTLPPVDCISKSLKNSMIDIVGRIGSFSAIDKNGRHYRVDYVGNWGRLYLGTTNHSKVDLDGIDIIYQV